jgi:hypothetical protein
MTHYDPKVQQFTRMCINYRNEGGEKKVNWIASSQDSIPYNTVNLIGAFDLPFFDLIFKTKVILYHRYAHNN